MFLDSQLSDNYFQISYNVSRNISVSFIEYLGYKMLILIIIFYTNFIAVFKNDTWPYLI